MDNQLGMLLIKYANVIHVKHTITVDTSLSAVEFDQDMFTAFAALIRPGIFDQLLSLPSFKLLRLDRPSGN